MLNDQELAKLVDSMNEWGQAEWENSFSIVTYTDKGIILKQKDGINTFTYSIEPVDNDLNLVRVTFIAALVGKKQFPPKTEADGIEFIVSPVPKIIGAALIAC